MSMFITYAPVLQHTATENTSALPAAPEHEEVVRPARTRFFAAALLRRAARIELAAAAHLERRPSGRRLVSA